MSDQLSPPGPDEVEISLFGPGYGEAIVIHLGHQHWLIVDSCLEPRSGNPAALENLATLNVDVATAVKLVVATHWHDDHIRGIAAVLRKCISAKFALSAALCKREFQTLIGLYRGDIDVGRAGLREFVAVSNVLAERRRNMASVEPCANAIVDRVLYRTSFDRGGGRVEANVYALSPSDAALELARLTFAELLPREGEQRRRLPSPTPNHVSVVLGGTVGERTFLLGADLERTSDPQTGWSVVVDNQTVRTGKAEVFKVAHHGAESGHEPPVWDELLVPQPYALLTPWVRGGTQLPTRADIDRLMALTAHAYITAPPRRRRQRWTNPVVRDMVRRATKDIYEVHAGWGQLRLRCTMTEASQPWEVATFGDACSLRDVRF